MRCLSVTADSILAAFVALHNQHDEQAQAAFGTVMTRCWHEVDELLARGFVKRNPEGLVITEAGWAYATEQIKAVVETESYSRFEPGCAGFKMRLIFDFQELKCERTVLVPAHITFEEFHTIIQATMSWMNYHLFDFSLDDRDGNPLVLTHLGPTPYAADAMWQMFSMDDGDEEGERLEAADVYLDSIFPDVSRAVYNYDYGDDWLILIECLGAATLEDGFPTCLEGTGDAPPEDVGGEWGFQEFLDIIDDPSDPDYRHMVEWGQSQGYMPFELNDVVARLRMWRNYTATDAKSYELAPGGPSAKTPQPPSDEELAAHNEEVEANKAACATYLDIFEKSLRASRLSDKTVERHLATMKLYLLQFLNDGDVCTMQEGAALVDDFMGRWAPINGRATKTLLKGYATGLKKFYKCMLDEGLVSAVQYGFLLDEIQFNMDEWLAPFESSYGRWY